MSYIKAALVKLLAILLLLVLSAGAGNAAIAVTNLGSSGASATSTITFAIPVGGVPAGSTIVAVVVDNSSGSSGGTLSDTKNTYTQIISAALNGSTTNGFGAVWYSYNVVALTSSDTLTYTFKGAPPKSGAMSVFYITGLASGDPLDNSSATSATGSSTSPSVTSGTPDFAGEIFIGAVAQGNTTTTFSQAAGWATPPVYQEGGGGAGLLRGEGGGNLLNATTSTKTYAPTLGASRTWAAMIVSFEPFGVGGNTKLMFQGPF